MCFIKTPGEFKREYSLLNTAPRFRKVFDISGNILSATLRCAGLGIGYFYINGNRVSRDRFTAPVSNYNKTVWYNEYDVTALLKSGENVAAVIVGNGFYNESFSSLAKVNTASWRDKPKMFFELTIECENSTHKICSDNTWRCTDSSPVVFNMIRSGECYDARLYEKGWNDTGFDDSAWDVAEVDQCPPTGVLRKCECEPIHEFEVFSPEEITGTGDGRYLFKFPKTISGYIALSAGKLSRGQKVIIRYAECINKDGTLDFKIADSTKFYPEEGYRYAWDEFTADGEDFTWSPRFAYHGFRYIQIEGLNEPPGAEDVSAVFVHQDIGQKTTFECSDERLNRIYDMGINATFGNMFYMPTDCPSREKLGWTNDAQSSAEQFLLNFQSEKLLKKWFRDILDAMHDDGALPGVVPTENYGYEWGAGPTSTGIIFEIPYRLFKYTGDDGLLISALPYFKRHLSYIKSKADERGLINYGLCDWAGPWEEPQMSPTPLECSNTLLYMKFLKICAFAATRAGDGKSREEAECEYRRIREVFLKEYVDKNGDMKVKEQCALALAIVLDICEDNSAFARQLEEVALRDDYHISCGMLGIRYIFRAFDKINRHDLAYKMITAEGFPGYFHWINEFDATSLLEMWSGEKSHNHHMYSEVLVWLMTTLGGINLTCSETADYEINPYCAEGISWCKVSRKTEKGEVKVAWEKKTGRAKINITLEGEISVLFKGEYLKKGENTFTINL